MCPTTPSARLAGARDDQDTPGRPRVGTRWREVVRPAPGLHLTMHSEVTAMEPDRMLAMRFRGGHLQGDIRYTLTADDETTLLRQQERMRATGWLRLADCIHW